MAISVGLITNGLSLLTFILKRVWSAEDEKKTGDEKHEHVKGYVYAYLEKQKINIDDVDGFISDVINLLNKHKIFTTKGDE